MDQRRHPWSDAGRHSHRTKDKDDYYRYSQQDRGQGYPPPDLRDRDRHWAHPGARYGAHFTGHNAWPEQYPYSPQQYPYGYGQPEHQRPQSRHGYDCPPSGHWDHRDSYGYYSHGYYKGQHGQPDSGQWAPQDPYTPDRYCETLSKQEHPRSSCTEDRRYDQWRDGSQPYLSDYEDNRSRDNEEVSSYYLGTLERSKHSGLSSSSYELSQYINGAEQSDPVPQPAHTHLAERVHQTPAPLKYSLPHAVASFGPAGQLIRVTPGFSTQENTSKLEIHSLEVIMSETQEQLDMRSFPGPLTREDLHKIDAIEFAYQMTGACMREDKLQDKSSAALLWNLLILLCRQNAQTVGSDIAELLMQGSQADGGWESDGRTLIDFNESAATEAPPCKGDDLLTGNGSSFSSESPEKALQSYTQLLLAGRKKEALESAMSSGLWGHALFLASKMDNRSYSTVLNRFTGQLAASDPLHTLFQLLSGRLPAVTTCCGNEKCGDWRPHLAVMLSNGTGDPDVQQKAVVAMGDTLASRGLVHAAHVCYLTAHVPFGVFTNKAERLVLVGSSHRQPFQRFATNAAIRCTELYEYCLTLGGRHVSVPSFQVYKLIYASRLLDCGLASQASHYCEVVGRAILRRKEPSFVLAGQVIKLADGLRCCEGRLSDTGAGGADGEPDWLRLLRARHHGAQMGNSDCAETCQPPAGGDVALDHSEACSGSDLDDLSGDTHSPEPEHLYYQGPEDLETLSDLTGGRAGLFAGPTANPLTADHAPTSQHFSLHNTDSAEVRTVSLHCPATNPPSAADGLGSSAEAAVGTWGQRLEADVSHQGQAHQSAGKVSETPEQTTEPPQQSTRTGWFSGWFRSKPKDVQEESSDHGGLPHTEAPLGTGSPAPPPAAMILSQPSSPGINPFSRKAGQQLG